MLIENDLSGHNLYCSIIGIGINLNQAVFRGDAPNPVSLFQIIGKEVDREEVLDRFLSVLFISPPRGIRGYSYPLSIRIV